MSLMCACGKCETCLQRRCEELERAHAIARRGWEHADGQIQRLQSELAEAKAQVEELRTALKDAQQAWCRAICLGHYDPGDHSKRCVDLKAALAKGEAE